MTFNACHLSKYKRSQFLEPSFGFFYRRICFGILDGPCLVPKLLAGVSSGKIDQRGTGEGNKADGEYRYCNGRRYCHYSGPYTGHASTQWSPDPSKEVPTLPQAALSVSSHHLDAAQSSAGNGLFLRSITMRAEGRGSSISYRRSLIGRGRLAQPAGDGRRRPVR